MKPTDMEDQLYSLNYSIFKSFGIVRSLIFHHMDQKNTGSQSGDVRGVGGHNNAGAGQGTEMKETGKK